jgi:hypothetical protein
MDVPDGQRLAYQKAQVSLTLARTGQVRLSIGMA